LPKGDTGKPYAMDQEISEPFTNVRGRAATLSEVATVCGVAPETVRRWVDQGCPVLRKSDGRKGGTGWKFSTHDVIEWRIAREKRRSQSEEHIDLEEARRRKLAAEAELAEIEAAKQRGDVVPVEDVAKVVADQLTACRARLLSIPTKLAPVLISSTDLVECRALLEAAVDEALHELVGYAPDGDEGGTGREAEGGTGPGEAGVPEAPAEAYSQPMGGSLPEAVA
jgi:phage terminase Nu1 subunit (DNA packaging protein)